MDRRLLAALAGLVWAASCEAADVNTASLAELESVDGLGTSITARILDERRNGPFKDWPDLIARVKGIGAGNAARFSAAGLTVDGATYGGTKPVAANSGGPPAGSRASVPASRK